MEECHKKVWNVFCQFVIAMPFSPTYSRKVGARVSLEVPPKKVFEVNEALKFIFLDAFFKAKTEQCEQKV